MQNFRRLPPCVLGNLSRRKDMPRNSHRWSDGPTDRCADIDMSCHLEPNNMLTHNIPCWQELYIYVVYLELLLTKLQIDMS